MSELDRKELAKKLDIHYQAFDIYRETGLTPRQLADQRAELLGQALEALEAARIELENEGAWVPTKVTDVLELAGKEK